MGRNIESILFKGFVNKSLIVSLVYTVDISGKYVTIKENENNGAITTFPRYFLKIIPGKDLPRLMIMTNQYFPFTELFDKVVRLTQENLFELFPNVNKLEFDINERVLERFQKEKALNTANITMMPSVYTDGSGGCFPGIRISLDTKDAGITIPLEDAIAMNRFFKVFEPNTYCLELLTKLVEIV